MTDRKTSIVTRIRELKELVMMDDGFWYYWPDKNSTGGYSMTYLRIIADHLEELNHDWEEQIGRDLANVNPTTELPEES